MREEQIEPTWIDRGAGSGSNTIEEDWTEMSSREGPNDGRSQTRTTFYDDADGGTDTDWTGLAALNDGLRSPDRSQRNNESDQTRFIELLCSALECTEHQANQVQWVIDDIDNLREFFPTAPYEHVILATISLVVDRETTDFENWIVRRDDFRRIMEEIDMDMSRLWSLREKLTEESALFDD